MTESKLTLLTTPWDLGGKGKFRDDLTIEQDAGRAAVMEFLTVMAKESSSGKLVPLTSVDPTLTPAFLTCGAIDGTAAEFAAVTDAELSITVDGVVIDLADMDMSGLDSVSDTPGYLTCAALAVALPIFQAEADAQFGITIDGILTNVTCDFSGLDTEADVPGSLQCGANGANLGAWQAVGDGAFNVTVNGVVINITGCVFTSIVDLSDVAAVINEVALGRFTVLYDHTADTFAIVSNTTGETSIVTVLSAPGAGTDISGAGFLDGQTGAGGGVPTAGTGGEGTAQTVQDIINAELVGLGFCYYDGDQFIFVSRTAGELSTVGVLTAGTGGTDVSGAGFLNGAAGAATAGTGGEGLYESISDIINAHAEGRFTCEFNGDAFVFISPTAGLPASSISVLSDPAAGGTDISGVGFLNGITAVGTVTAATGSDGTDKPAGIYMGNEITAAALVAGDIDDQPLLIGSDKMIDEDMIVLENSLTLADVVVATGRTIREELELMGIYPRKSINDQQIQPI